MEGKKIKVMMITMMITMMMVMTAEDYIPMDINKGYFISYNENNERKDVVNM